MTVTPNLWSGTAKALVGALYGDPAKAAALESDRASAGLNLEKTRGERMKNDSLNPDYLAESLRLARGDDPAAGLGRIGATGLDPRHYLTAFNAQLATGEGVGEIDADRFGRAAVLSAGSSPSENFAATSSRADQISSRDAGEAMSQALATQKLRNQGDIDLQSFKYNNDPSRKALADLLNPEGDQTDVTPQGLGDRLFKAGLAGSNEEMMRMGLLENQRQYMNEANTSRKINQQVEDYAKAADDYSGFAGSITNFADTLGKYPSGTDIPGLGATGGLPSIVLSDEGKQVRQDYMAVANGIVYLLSGKQINEAEAKRLAQQMGGTVENGTFKITNQFTDDQVRRGIENVSRQIQGKLKNTGALLSPDALDLYTQRGGALPPTFLDEVVAGFGAPEGTQGAQDGGIPPDAVTDLLADPSPEAQTEFDQVFGVGAAQSILSRGQ